MTESIHLSVSQIKKFQACQRQWGFRYIEGLPEPPRQSSSDGKDIHADFESYSKGEGIPEGKWQKVVLEGIRHLPPPGTGDVEQQFEMTFAGVKLVGIKDLCHFDKALGLWVVTDHKTCGTFRYTLTAGDFLTDEQSVIYSMHTMLTNWEERVVNRWVYHLRNPKAPESRVVEATIHLDQIKGRFDELESIGRDMVDCRRNCKSARELPRNPDHCDSYGGCPYRGICEDNQEKIRRLQKMDIRAKLKRRKEAKAQAVEAEGINPPEGAEGAAPLNVAQKMDRALASAKKDDPETIKERVDAVLPKEKAPAKKKKAPTKKEMELRAEYQLLGEGFTLYVDCVPVGSPCVDFAIVAAKVVGELRYDLEGQHYRQVKGYGGNAAILEAAVSQYLNESPIEGGLFVDSSTNEGKDCLTMLSSRAKVVVRALR